MPGTMISAGHGLPLRHVSCLYARIKEGVTYGRGGRKSAMLSAVLVGPGTVRPVDVCKSMLSSWTKTPFSYFESSRLSSETGLARL